MSDVLKVRPGNPMLRSGEHLPTADRQEHFAEITRAAPPDPAFEAAFLASRLRFVESHPHIAEPLRVAEISRLRNRLRSVAAEPTEVASSRVGYGVYYTDVFRQAFHTGTAIAVTYIAPTRVGGNASGTLYLTATNRAQRGVEALIWYNAQDELRFGIYDWARSDNGPWQTNIGFSELSDYITTQPAHGADYQVLYLQNTTQMVSGDAWCNEVLLKNCVLNRWDLAYRYEYLSSEADQKQGPIGLWGPIVEAFEPWYTGTNVVGCLDTYLETRGPDLQWEPWRLLSPAESYIRNDEVGFRTLFLDENFGYAVH